MQSDTPPPRHTGRGLEAALLAFTLWGLLTLYWKHLEHLPALEMIGWRVCTATVLMLAVGMLRGGLGNVFAALRNRATLARVALAAVLLSANWTTYVWAVGHGRVVETALGYFLSPLGTIAIGTRVFGERMTVLQRVSVGCTVIAVAVLTVSYGRLPWVALVLAASWSLYGLIKRGIPLAPTESLTSELLVLLVPAVLVVASGWFRSGGIPDLAHGFDWVMLAGTGLITAVPLTLFAYAAKRVPFTVLGPANYLVPIINFLLGWLAFGEDVPVSRFVGFGFVWTALALVTIDTFRHGRPRAVAESVAEPISVT